MPLRIALIGNCDPDNWSLQRRLGELGHSVVAMWESVAETQQALPVTACDLLIINRVFDATGESGLDLISSLKRGSAEPSPAVMLLSNFAWAQQAARELGALPGFGKSELSSPQLSSLFENLSSSEKN